MGHPLKQVEVGGSFSVKSSLVPSSSARQKGLLLTLLPEDPPKYRRSTSTSSLKSRRMGCSTVPLQWSRMREGIRRKRTRKNVFRIMSSRMSNNGRNKQKTITETGSNCCLLEQEEEEGQDLSSEEQEEEEEEEEASSTSREEIDPALLSQSQDNICRGLRFDPALQTKADIFLLSQKYQPKLFQDIKGHEFTVKAISKAVEKMKIARLYLFHGPNGTGKTSTARIFAMALNCESTSHTKPKPCWSCRGCSRSLYIMELCSGSRIAGFERMKTLLQSTSFTQAIPGFKVLIIKECHTFNAEAWDELLGIVETQRVHGSRVVFVLVTVDANMVPTNISSRCQKFCFPKLKDEEMTLKLAKIVACEDIRIDKEALKLIIAKAEGSLREAENLLDQLALLGSAITSSMVQQLVGLVPQNKLLDLLATAISGDTVKTIRYTRELIATGVEPRALVSQLAYLISDIISGAVVSNSSSSTGSSKDKRLLRSRSQLANTQSERLCGVLKILVETEKQLRSSTDQNSRILAALLEITSEDVRNRISTGIILPRKMTSLSGGNPNAVSKDIYSQRLSGSRSNIPHHSINRTSKQLDMDRIEPRTTIKSIDQIQRSRGKEVQKEPNLAHMSDMEEIWQNMLGRIESRYIKDFLCHQVKLASLTVSSANMIVHLMFKRHEDKMAAQMSEESISKALKNAFGCPVTVNMSLEPVDLEIIKGNAISSSSQSVNHTTHSKQHQRIPYDLEEFFHSRNFEAAMHHTTALELSPPSEQHPRPMKSIDCTVKERQHIEEKGANTTWPQNISPFLGLLTQKKNQSGTSTDPERDVVLTRARNSIDTAPHILTANKPKHRWLSLSSIPQSDASVEPYSQDILFEKATRESNTRKNCKFQKGFLTTTEDREPQDIATHQKLNPSWSCTGILCPRKKKGNINSSKNLKKVLTLQEGTEINHQHEN